MKNERKFKREDVISPRHNTNIKVVAKKTRSFCILLLTCSLIMPDIHTIYFKNTTAVYTHILSPSSADTSTFYIPSSTGAYKFCTVL